MPRLLTPWNQVLAACLLALTASAVRAQDAAIQWRASYNAAREEAKLKNLPLLVDFMNVRCSHCDKLDQFTFTEPRLIKLVNERFVAVKINYSVEPSLAAPLNVDRFPTIILLASDGTSLHTSVGFRNADALHEMLQQTLAKLVPACPLQEKYLAALKLKSAGEYTRAVSYLREILDDGKSPAVSKKAKELLTTIEKQAEERLNIAKEMHAKGRVADALDLYANIYRTFPDLTAGRTARNRRDHILATIEKQAEARLVAAKKMHATGPIVDALPIYADVWRTYPDLAAGRAARDRLNQLAQRHPDARELMKDDYIPCIVQNEALWGLCPYGPVPKCEPVGLLFSKGEFVPRPQPTTDLKVFDYERSDGLQQTKALLTTYNLKERYVAAVRAHAGTDYMRAVAHLRFILADGTAPTIAASAQELLTSIEQHAEDRLNLAKEIHFKGRVADALERYAEVWRTFPTLAAGRDARDRLNLLAQRNPRARELMKQDFVPCIVRHDTTFGLWPYGQALKAEPLGLLRPKGEFVPKQPPLVAMKVFDFDKVAQPTTTRIARTKTATALVAPANGAISANGRPTSNPTTPAAPRADARRTPPSVADPTMYYVYPSYAPNQYWTPPYGSTGYASPGYAPTNSYTPRYNIHYTR